MRQQKRTSVGRVGGLAALRNAPNMLPTCARALLILPASLLLIASNGVFAATVNSEAAAPQRTVPTRAIQAPAQTVAQPAPRPAPRPAARSTAPTSSAQPPSGVAASSSAPKPLVRPPATMPAARPVAGTSTVPSPSRAVQEVRQASIPVLGREGPAAVAAQARVRQIAITASEPELTSAVRTSDVAGFQKIGAPYQVGGTWYVPAHEPDYDETGIASWYGNEFQGKPTANGEIFDMNVVSGAHPTLPIPSLVEVTNLANGRSIIVRINDRGPFVGNRLIDMSARGALLLGFREQGHTNVRVRYVGPADVEPRVTPQNLTAPTHLAANMATKPLPPSATPPALPQAREMAATTQTAPALSQQAFVQVGAFSQVANAQRLREQAASLGPVQIVEATNAQGGILYRVVLGPIANRAEALAKVEELNNSGVTSARLMASLN